MLVEWKQIEERLRLLLASELGQWNNGKPATWVGNKIPPELQTTGLRCRIQPAKEGNVFPVSGGTFEDQSWVVELVNFADDTKLILAKQKIERSFVLSRPSVYVPSTDLAFERCRMFLSAPKLRSL